LYSFLLDQKRNKKVKNERQLQVLVYPQANSFIALKLAVRTVYSFIIVFIGIRASLRLSVHTNRTEAVEQVKILIQ
jgi:hypothetical protein